MKSLKLHRKAAGFWTPGKFIVVCAKHVENKYVSR